MPYWLDSSNPGRISLADLNGWASMAGLVELWRWKHPTSRCYYHVSLTHRSAARIDLVFGNNNILKYVESVEYLAGGVSDHNPLSLTLSFLTEARKGSWRLSVGCLQNEQVAAQIVEKIKTYWSTTTEPPIVWDACKAVTREECISAIKTARVNENEELKTEREGVCGSPCRIPYRGLI